MNGIHPGVGAVDLQFRLYYAREKALKLTANQAAADTRAVVKTEAKAATAPALKPVF